MRPHSPSVQHNRNCLHEERAARFPIYFIVWEHQNDQYEKRLMSRTIICGTLPFFKQAATCHSTIVPPLSSTQYLIPLMHLVNVL